MCMHVCDGGDSPILMPWGSFSLETEKLQAEGGRAEVYQCGRQLPDGARQEEPGAAERGESQAALSPPGCYVMGLGTSGDNSGCCPCTIQGPKSLSFK